jgi:hypothetical protein
LNGDQDALLWSDFMAGYTGEVTYLIQRFLNIVDRIIQKSIASPIIILQGDHGMPRLAGLNMANLNVYYLPAGGEANLYPSLSPVNSFPVVFNAYFGGHVPLLSDKACNFSKGGVSGSAIQVDPEPQC